MSLVAISLEDGSFSIDGVTAGGYDLLLPSYSGRASILQLTTYVSAIKFDGQDVLNDGLRIDGPTNSLVEITMRSDPAVVSGRVVDERGTPFAAATVVLIPDFVHHRRSDLYRVATGNSLGWFQFSGIAPGVYRVFAFQGVETWAWRNAEFLSNYESRGTTVRATQGNGNTVELTVIRAAEQ
jgi:hypothetical protein